MTQKTWEKQNTITQTNHICCNCGEPITNHKHYTDYRFCETCQKEIITDYNRKCSDPDDKEQINYFGWYSAEDYLQSVYEELTNNNDSIYYE